MSIRRVFYVSFASLMLFSCAPKNYQLSHIERTRIIVDDRYDQNPDEAAIKFIEPFKRVNDSIMGPVVGMVAHNMHADRPESDLSNLLADILVWAAKDYGEQPVLGIYNMGGIRADLTKGKVTYGDVLDVAPFENKICFITLTGEKMLKLFQQIAKRGGEGVSHGVELVISKDEKLISCRLHGKEIDPKAEYRVATINYLIEGNDGMPALKEGTNIIAPNDKSNNTRFLIMNYFKDHQARGLVVDSNVEGRIKIQ
ncbi:MULTISPECIES: 5'-nucleotidase [unclassified Prevotella]|uniref:5'-nucleotidase C-terminal domain-containing protein n=1 Tax=unclassified Prevotella TaxID=2638335 RepID=UPI00048B6AC3